jgi:hypothetical protein
MSWGEGFVRRFSLASLVAAALIASGAWAAQSSQAAVTLGSDLAAEPEVNFSCFNVDSTRGCLFVTDVLPGRQLISPFDGVIVRWRVRVGATTDAQTIRIRVVRRVDPDQFTAISSGQLESIPAGAGTYTFPAQLPIRSGDQVGGEADSNTDIQWGLTQGDAHLFGYNPSPPDGETTLTPVFIDPWQVTLNVDVEPDCDKDGLGDETQDADVSTCHSNAFTFAGLKRNKKKGTATLNVNVPEPGELIGSGNGAKVSAAGATTSKAVTPGTAQLLIKAKGKKKRKLNETGKVKLSLAVTYTPTRGKLNTQSIKVKLKKKL